MDVMFVFLGIPSGILNLAGLARSNALVNVLPGWGTKVWAVAILAGCVMWLVGLTSITENNGHLVLTRMPALLLGLYLVSLTTLVYGVALIVFSGWSGFLASVPLFVISGGTWLRRVDFSSRFRGETS
jgi:hypothetical protein